ncbi:hypothetical protein [Magnetofaba australis]|uniref:MamD-like protein n=1 Tax=Magnetofaba australis IT-1 TaxID=1434232 RepID=W0LJE4_9PROT|nr:hypothetical protein [Magnetofaba australis]AHG23911.1 MamD-like protein [Magnetofaba australis IT-1]OSM08658.1 putative magnetosome MamD-like protein [Magnetofaba australis IT-1]
MPAPQELIGPQQLANVTGKSFTVKDLGNGKALLCPLPEGGGAALSPIEINNAVVEGLKAAKGQAPGMAPVVSIEGAGKTVSPQGQKLLIDKLQIKGVMAPGGERIVLSNGEMKIGPAPKSAAKAAKKIAKVQAKATAPQPMAKAAAATPPCPAANTPQPSAQNVAMTQNVAAKAVGGGAAKAAAVGTIWNGGGWSLGLGLGLGVWGVVAATGLAAAAIGVGVYNYKSRQLKAEG